MGEHSDHDVSCYGGGNNKLLAAGETRCKAAPAATPASSARNLVLSLVGRRRPLPGYCRCLSLVGVLLQILRVVAGADVDTSASSAAAAVAVAPVVRGATGLLLDNFREELQATIPSPLVDSHQVQQCDDEIVFQDLFLTALPL